MKYFFIVPIFFILGCSNPEENIQYTYEEGCDGQVYPKPSESQYVLPFEVGKTFRTGLTNCSSSFHSADKPDQYAFDFDMPWGTTFVAARGGVVYQVVQSSSDQNPELPKTAIVGNYVIIDHQDGTYGIYLHSPDNGISVSVRQLVKQGDILGVTGDSGLAGYPHLHFIVVKSRPVWPYEGVAISFKNAYPAHTALHSYTEYKATTY